MAGEPYERPRVFCASLCDVFEDRPDLHLDAWRAELWPLIEACDELDWMLLTKRPENIPRMAPPAWLKSWPAHAWAGTSVEDQEAAHKRIPYLVDVPARVHFLSMEPLLASVAIPALQLLQLVIVGGEGHGGRPCDVDWIRSIVRQCEAAGVACFVKQLGSMARVNARPYTPDEERHALRYSRGQIHGSRTVEEFLKLKHPKGGDPSEWPEDLRVREMPRRLFDGYQVVV